MIYREQSDKTNTKTWPPTDVSRLVLTRTAKALFSDATNLAYQFLYNHVATAIEVSQGVAMWHGASHGVAN